MQLGKLYYNLFKRRFMEPQRIVVNVKSRLIQPRNSRIFPIRLITPNAEVVGGNTTQEPQHQFSIPGINNIINKQYPTPLRIFWIVVIVTCFLLTLIQTIWQVQLYLINPVKTSTSVNRELMMTLPNITFCSSTMLMLVLTYSREVNLSVYHDLLDLPFKSVEQFWKEVINVTAEEIQFSPKCLKNKPCNYIYEDLEDVTLWGVCRTFNFISKVPYRGRNTNFLFKLKRQMKNKNDPNKEILDKYLNSGYQFLVFIYGDHINGLTLFDALYNYFFVEVSKYSSFSFNIKEIITVNRQQNPCEDPYIAKQCRDSCLHEFIVKKSNCRLPFMKNLTIPECQWKQFQQVILGLLELMFEFNIASCKCMKPCRDIELGIIEKIKSPIDQTSTLVVMNLGNNVKETIEESFEYSLSSLMCNIGGNLGLFLGCCILSILEFLEIFVWKIYRICGKKFKR